ncbi:MAG: carboxypeptidase-like regulatory domain-containing protein [Candidatus Eisenbacteria bacterium]
MLLNKTLLVISVVVAMVLCCVSCQKEAGERQSADEGESPAFTAADSLHWDLLVAHLQANFDDFHDVTMRFHHQDPTFNGLIEIKVMWENRVLTSAEIVKNETGSDDLAKALIAKMQSWEIEGLDGPLEIVVPIKVKLVGLDDPEFPNTGILTGEVLDVEEKPLEGVMVLIKPEVAGMVVRAQTNREGIFVRTLIPPGTWDVECSLQGYKTVRKEGIKLSAGKHVRESVTLEKR